VTNSYLCPHAARQDKYRILNHSIFYVVRSLCFVFLLLGLTNSVNSQIVHESEPDKTPVVDSPKTHDPYQRDYTATFLAKRLGSAQRTTSLTGIKVWTQSGSKAGKLEDFVVDLNSGRLLCALVSLKESWTVVPVPPKSFRSAEDSGAILDATKTKFNGAPRRDGNEDLTNLFNALPASYSYFDQKFTWDQNTQPALLIKSKDLIGLAVVNKSSEPLGSVVNLMVDVATERVVFAIVSFSSTDKDIYAVPPAALHTISGEKSLLLDAEKTKIAVLAQSDGFFWSNLADLERDLATYKAFGQTADFDAAQEKVRTTTSDGTNTVTSPANNTSETLQQDILMAMMREDPENVQTFKNVAILTINGKVTLSGRLRSEKQRSKLISIVASVVGAENIHDQLHVN
jgi:sporulation protein YlmC with PRC-barrel domain